MHVALYFHGRLPARGYGGTQRVVVWLARGLVELGHQVSLLAPRESVVPGVELIPLDPGALRRLDFDLTPHAPAGADILHLHAPLRIPPQLPNVATVHGNAAPGHSYPPNTIFLSADHAHRHGASAWVHNGLDPSAYRYRETKGDYDLFLGRLHSAKGYRWALAGARLTGRRLLLAGGWRPSFRRNIRYVGSVDGARKSELLAGARCLWMPALWDEPFGLTLIEAMASGTPVLGTRRGALPEIVTPDVGFLGDSVEELAAFAKRSGEIRPADCRARVERWFSHRTMAAAYVRCYEAWLRGERLPAGERPTGE